MFTEENSRQQDAAFAELKAEFSRLEQQEKDLRKAVGLPEEGALQVKDADVTPEVREALEEAKARAKREGAARATQFKNGASSACTSESSSTFGGRRKGIMRI